MIGDMDARFGEAVRHLLTLMDTPNIEEFSHPSIPDNVNVPYTITQNFWLQHVSTNNSLLVINNLKYREKHFPGKKSFRRGDTWVSELDTCVISSRLLDFVKHFAVLQRAGGLPSDHALITINGCCQYRRRP